MCHEKHKPLKRVYYINNQLLKTVKTIYRLRKIGFQMSNGKPVYAYAISIAKDYGQTLEEQALHFYNTCQQLLKGSEKLLTDKKCFKIVSDEFDVYYCMEAWRKHADKVVYVENGQVKIEMLHRMSCEQAAYIYKKRNVDPFDHNFTTEIAQPYDTPADKYVALAKALNATSTHHIDSLICDDRVNMEKQKNEKQ